MEEDPATTIKRAISHDRAMRKATEDHDGTWSAAVAVQNHRIKRNAARANLPPLRLVAN